MVMTSLGTPQIEALFAATRCRRGVCPALGRLPVALRRAVLTRTRLSSRRRLTSSECRVRSHHGTHGEQGGGMRGGVGEGYYPHQNNTEPYMM